MAMTSRTRSPRSSAPGVYRQYLFPWMEQLASIAHDAGLPFAFHSDGRLWEVIPDLMSLGVNALHPIEPKAMDINEVKARFGKNLALIGNIDMDIPARGTPAQVRELVRQRIRDLAPGGGYAVGANPGIADYVLPENYRAHAGSDLRIRPLPDLNLRAQDTRGGHRGETVFERRGGPHHHAHGRAGARG